MAKFSCLFISLALLISSTAANEAESCNPDERSGFRICGRSDVITSIYQTRKTESLQLSSNSYSEIGPQAFKNVTIKKLSFVHPNPTQCIPKFVRMTPETFDGLHGLEKFVLDCVKFPMKPNLFENLKSVVNLWLKRVEFIPLQEYTFADFPNLRRLTLYNANIKSITARILSKINENLEKLRIVSKIQEIEPKSFERFRHLKALHLNAGKLRNLPKGLFDGIQELMILNLARNGIEELPADTFISVPRLERLSLSINALTKIENNTFRGLSHLTELDLGTNFLGSIPKVCTHLNNLEHLNLRRNEIKLVEKNSLGGCSKLRYLDLSFNEIKSIEPMGFRDLNLKYLALRNNLINSVGSYAFFGLRVNTLDLNKNNILQIQQWGLKGLSAEIISLCFKESITGNHYIKWGYETDPTNEIENSCP